ncbi:MAG: hypothetical protein KXJ48_04105 [Vulcanococcus sp.]|nr:hypothetical protein [Vulcanococcus sp.]
MAGSWCRAARTRAWHLLGLGQCRHRNNRGWGWNRLWNGLALLCLPPGPPLRISSSQLLMEGLNLIHALAVNPLTE